MLNRIITNGGKTNTLYAEKRGPELDIQLEAEYEKLCKVGIHRYSAKTVVERTKLHLRNKKDNINGLQVIDLILSCIARVGLGKSDKMINNDLCHDPKIKDKIIAATVFPKERK